MKLEIASKKAIDYAIRKWHYSRKVPAVKLGYSVFNGTGEWCGIIAYGIGANPQIGKPYGLAMGEIVELLRVALNGKQETTTKAVSLSLKLLKKDLPLVRLVVSYADSKQGHLGIIYQASNWIYTMESKCDYYIEKSTGRLLHSKTAAEKYKGLDRSNLLTVPQKPKYKYVYCIDRSLLAMIEKLRKPYPKEIKRA